MSKLVKAGIVAILALAVGAVLTILALDRRAATSIAQQPPVPDGARVERTAVTPPSAPAVVAAPSAAGLAGPPVVPLPEDPDDRNDALESVRQQRTANMMSWLNRPRSRVRRRAPPAPQVEPRP
jgi:hypothetical protein